MKIAIAATTLVFSGVTAFAPSTPTISRGVTTNAQTTALFAGEEEEEGLDLNLEEMFDMFDAADKEVDFDDAIKDVKNPAAEVPADPEWVEPVVDPALINLAQGLNPTIGYYDPLSLATADFWDAGNEATVGFLRHAEIKHGRVAMAAFVGYCVQSNWVFPWPNTLAGDPFPSVDLNPEQQWDALPTAARRQIIFIIALLEIWDELKGSDPERKHYMKGGRPGEYPSFQPIRDDIHWTLDLYDPFKLTKKMTREKKDRRLLMEINNGRLAMLGIFSFLAADKVEGSVPLLKGIAIPYDGDIMVPFSSDGSFFTSWAGAAADAVSAATEIA